MSISCSRQRGPAQIQLSTPRQQVAFYVPGIGTPAARHNTIWDRSKETVRQMFGFGLTQKITDCYVAIMTLASVRALAVNGPTVSVVFCG